MGKAINKLIISVIIIFVFVHGAVNAFAQPRKLVEPPVLKSISFENAEIDGEFEPNQLNYDIVLKDSGIAPTLKSYSISKDAFIFVNYDSDNSNRQTMITVDVKNENITTSYVFKYANTSNYKKNSNSNLAYAGCCLGEVYPKLSDNNTDYSLYIPSDMTEVTLEVATQDIYATYQMQGTVTLSPDQTAQIPVTVTATDGSSKIYNFRIKRLEKNTDQVKQEMLKPDFISLVEGELFYQKPMFRIMAVCIVGGLVVLFCLIAAFKRLVIKAEDEDEEEFFDIE